jgi:NAD-dependent deacetylase
MEELALPPELGRRLAGVRRVVAFTGAGVSRESGLATFRGGDDALWERFRPEELATPEAFRDHPGRVWRWYAARYRAAAAAQPNAGHRALARFGEVFPFFTLVTQNVDGLHQRAGSREVLELHGTLTRARCDRCGHPLAMALALERSPAEPPSCPCGGRLRPAVVWFGEVLPADVLERAGERAARCELLVTAGTSATVYPAAGLIEIARRAGAVVVEVNPEPSALSALADLCILQPAGRALPALLAALEKWRRPAT